MTTSMEDRDDDLSALLCQLVSAEARGRRVRRWAIGANLALVIAASVSVGISARDASSRRYVRAGALLSTTLVDEARLSQDVSDVVRVHATAVNEAVGPRWPGLAKRTLAAHASMQPSLRRYVDKTVKQVFLDEKTGLRDRLEVELSQLESPPTLTDEQLDRVVAEAEVQARQTVRDAVALRTQRSHAALESLVRELPGRASARWTARWTDEAARGLDAIGKRFVEQHEGLPAADWTEGLKR